MLYTILLHVLVFKDIATQLHSTFLQDLFQRLPFPSLFHPNMEPLNLQHLLTRFSDHWSQRTIGTLNDYEIKLAKLLGEFVWHSHTDTDELFFIIYGTLNIQLRDRDVILKPGEVFVVPRGVEHV